jgi:hypothetical protein
MAILQTAQVLREKKEKNFQIRTSGLSGHKSPIARLHSLSVLSAMSTSMNPALPPRPPPKDRGVPTPPTWWSKVGFAVVAPPQGHRNHLVLQAEN